MCKTLFGDEGELVVEELFKIGQCSMSNVIFKAAKRLRYLTFTIFKPKTIDNKE